MQTRLAAVVTSSVLVAAAFRGGPAEAQEPLPPAPTREQYAFALERQQARETELYARERRIPFQEAARRLRWLRVASTELVERGRRDLGESFGGVWIDPDTGRAKLGVAGGAPAARTDARSTLAAAHIEDGADLVTVEHSQATLDDLSAWLSERLAKANEGADLPATVGTLTDDNVVEVQLPRARKITAAEQAAIDEARERFGDALRVTRYDGDPESRACSGFNCDPPLRGGVRINTGSQPWCTSAFIVRGRGSNHAPFLMTAGHCYTGAVFTSRFSNGSFHNIGPFQNATNDGSGDAGILRIDNPGGWQAPTNVVNVVGSGEVGHNELYKIGARGTSVVGQTVCTSGASLGYSDCGIITQVNATIGGQSGLTRGNFCGVEGDSGAPMYKSNTAYGVHVGGLSFCDSWYTERARAENLTNTDVYLGPWS